MPEPACSGKLPDQAGNGDGTRRCLAVGCVHRSAPRGRIGPAACLASDSLSEGRPRSGGCCDQAGHSLGHSPCHNRAGQERTGWTSPLTRAATTGRASTWWTGAFRLVIGTSSVGLTSGRRVGLPGHAAASPIGRLRIRRAGPACSRARRKGWRGRATIAAAAQEITPPAGAGGADVGLLRRVPLCVIYEGRVSVKPWSAPDGAAGVDGRGPGMVAWTSHLFGRVAHGVVRPGRLNQAGGRCTARP
jgi:hypothetical protein